MVLSDLGFSRPNGCVTLRVAASSDASERCTLIVIGPLDYEHEHEPDLGDDWRVVRLGSTSVAGRAVLSRPFELTDALLQLLDALGERIGG